MKTRSPAQRIPPLRAVPDSQMRGQGSCEAALAWQSLLEALPIAAGVIAPRGAAWHLAASNTALDRLAETVSVQSRLPLIADEIVEQQIAAVMRTGEGRRFRWRLGQTIDERDFACSLVPLALSSGARGALLTLSDTTAEVRTSQLLRRQMHDDPLTGLVNRAGFVDVFEALIEEAGAEQYAIVVLNLTRFSRVNDCMGSLGGDELLVTVARRIKSSLRDGDLFGRIGADEFAIGVRLVDGPGDALHVASRVKRALAEPFRLSDFEIRIDGFIGCALAVDCADGGEQVMRHAQLALKTARATGRIEVYQPGVLEHARRRFTLETQLRRALDHDQLEIAFQPLVNLTTGKTIGFEALARWEDAQHGVVNPQEFISVAEDSGLIVPLGRWIVDRTLATLASWDRRAGRELPLYMAVNLSPSQVQRDNMPQVIEEALSQHGLSGKRLSIELTESMIISDPERAERMLSAVKALDVMIAMDDFGTGFSNLAALRRLPIDVLKIDQSFVTNMLGDPDKVAIVRAILSLAQALGMSTTAEGVESLELSRTLAGLGCNTGQGYFYAAPLGGEAAFAHASSNAG